MSQKKTKFYTVSDKADKVGRAPKFGEAMLVVALVLALLVYLILIRNISAQIALSICLFFACCFAGFLGFSWSRIEAMLMDGIRVGALAMIINLMIGMLIAAWCAAGVVPYLIDIGIKIIIPQFFLPMTCIACCILSVCCGSSWTTAGTVGLALFGIGTTMGIPGPMIVGPILTGAYFGDKLSPISESTNCAAAAAETDLMEHVHSMVFVVVPSTILACIIYGIMGWKYSGASVDMSALTELSTALHANFWLNPLLLIPLLVLGFCIFKKMGSIQALGIAIAVGIIFALTQGFSFQEICTALAGGLKLDTGVAAVDSMLGKGGLNSMTSVITIIICGMPLGSVLRETKTLETIVYHFKGLISSPGNVVASSTVTTTLLCFLTGNSYGAYILTSAAFGSAYDDWNMHRKVLSRVCEMAVVVQCLAPWTSGGAYMSGLFGMATMDYAPFYVWGYIVPIVTIICGYTGFGMFYNNNIRGGIRGWGKDKYVPDKEAFLRAAAERTEALAAN